MASSATLDNLSLNSTLNSTIDGDTSLADARAHASVAGLEQDEAHARSYMQQLQDLLSRDDDVALVHSALQAQHDATRGYARSTATARDAVSALQRAIDAEADAMATTSDKAQWEAALAAAQVEKRRLLERLQQARTQHDTTRAAIQDVKMQIDASRSAIERMETEQAAQIPRVRHMLSLYTNITNLRWDFKSAHVAGFIAPPRAAEPLVFDFEPGEMSEFELANKLWDLVRQSRVDATS